MEPIIFPGLKLQFNINPVAFRIFRLPVYWYGIIISLGFLIAFIIAINESKRINMDPESIMDIVLVSTPVAIIGARLYYVIFNWALYKDNFKEILSIRNGGLAIYGAIISALIAALIYCKLKSINVWKVFDIGGLGLIIAQSIGRWGNFINQEAYGRQTSLPWRMEIFDLELQTRIAVHPTFLYESLWNLVGFIFLMFYKRKKRFDGEVFLLYSLWYGLGRAWIEGLRTDSLYLNNFRISQVVAVLCVIISIGLITYLRKESYRQDIQ